MPKYVLDIYRLNVTAGTFARIDTIQTFTDLTFFAKLNGIGGCRFNMALKDPKTTAVNFIRYVNQVAVKRNGTVIWFGPITDLNGLYENVTGKVTIDCQTYQYHLDSRYTAKLKYYPSQDISLIATDLINTTQALTNGDLNITVGSTPTSILRDRTYEYKSISTALTDLSQLVGGFDYEFVVSQNYLGLVSEVVFNTYPNRLQRDQRNIAPFRIGQNVKSMNLKTWRSINNRSLVEGAGTGENIYVSDQSQPASQIAYTRREMINSLKDASLASTVSYYNTALLNQYAVEQYLIDLTMYQDRVPTLDDLQLGDIIYLNSDLGGSNGLFYFQNKQARILELNMQVDSQGAETIAPRVQIIN